MQTLRLLEERRGDVHSVEFDEIDRRLALSTRLHCGLPGLDTRTGQLDAEEALPQDHTMTRPPR